MSKFSDYLEYLIERNGEPIAVLSRNTHIERTSIHKSMTGERTLSYKSARKLADYLCLSPEESRLFFEYLNMQLQGEAAFETRKQIIKLLKNLADLPTVSSQEKKLPFPKLGEFPALKNQQLYSGEFAVRSILRQAIDQELGTESPVIFTNVPANDSFLLQYLYTIFQQFSTNLQVTHIIPYYSSERNAGISAGLSLLNDILALSLSAGSQYTSYFFYDRGNSAAPFPFYLLTSTCLLCIEKGYGTVLCITHPDTLAHYRRFFFHTLENCRPLLKFQKNPFEILDSYSAATSKNSYYTFMPQPCLGKFYSPALIGKKLKKDLPYYQMLLEKSEQRFRVLRTIEGHYYTFFTQKGLTDFMKTGIICDIPRVLIDPLTPAERKDLVKKLKTAIANGSVMGRLLNEALLYLPSGLSFCISARQTLDIFTLESPESPESFYNIHLDETLIGSAFLDFVLHLPQSEYLLGKEETLAFLDRLLANCR